MHVIIIKQPCLLCSASFWFSMWNHINPLNKIRCFSFSSSWFPLLLLPLSLSLSLSFFFSVSAPPSLCLSGPPCLPQILGLTVSLCCPCWPQTPCLKKLSCLSFLGSWDCRCALPHMMWLFSFFLFYNLCFETYSFIFYSSGKNSNLAVHYYQWALTLAPTVFSREIAALLMAISFCLPCKILSSYLWTLADFLWPDMIFFIRLHVVFLLVCFCLVHLKSMMCHCHFWNCQILP